MPIRVVQLNHPEHGRRTALVDGDQLRLLYLEEKRRLAGVDSTYNLAVEAARTREPLIDVVHSAVTDEWLDYDAIHALQSPWRLLPAADIVMLCPELCLVSGTGLTHIRSAQLRQGMHQGQASPQPAQPAVSPRAEEMTDSLRMYQWGLEGGKPAEGRIGVQPEWFYKGHGDILRGHGDELEVPPFAGDGGEEAEIAGVYIIDAEGTPRRVGWCAGNEFSDHVMERKNYLYLAPSKLRTCAIGPELVICAESENVLDDVAGKVRIERRGETLWSRDIRTGERNMSHTIANLEHHHFKYPAHRRPWEMHVHFLGADAFSFGDKIALEDGDVMEVQFEGFGRALRNTLRVAKKSEEPLRVKLL